MARPHEDISPHEDALFRVFIVPGRRDRFLKLLSSPKSRGKLLSQLPHLYDLDSRFAHRIPPGDQTVDRIYRLLKEKGAPNTCHVMGMSGLDGRDVDLRKALEEIVDVSFGNFISCIPGRLGYFGGKIWVSGTSSSGSFPRCAAISNEPPCQMASRHSQELAVPGSPYRGDRLRSEPVPRVAVSARPPPS